MAYYTSFFKKNSITPSKKTLFPHHQCQSPYPTPPLNFRAEILFNSKTKTVDPPPCTCLANRRC